MKKLLLFSFALIAALFFSSCEDEKNAHVEVWLTDEFGDYQQVNVDVQGVEIHSSETEEETGWKSLEVTPKVIDLLKLTNGEETFLGDLDLPAGKLSQIRLILGEDNTVMIDDATYQLSTPSAQQSGLKVKVNKTLGEGDSYKILLDFHAGKSVVKTGAGEYILKPVVTAVILDGTIKGVINPAAEVDVALFRGDDTDPVATTSSNADGEFLIQGLDGGTYRLVFGPSADPLLEKADVQVVLGEVTDIGVVSVTE